MARARRLALPVLALVAWGCGGPPAPEATPATPAPSRARYLGAAACAGCHEERFREFSRTTHHRTSAPASAAVVKGSFSNGRNILETSNRHLIYEMVMKAGEMWQVARRPGPAGTTFASGRIDMVVGSGKLGQSYVSERHDGLYQTPVSYVTAGDRWSYSPGYEDGSINFDRPVRPACLECHATYLASRDYRSHAFKVADVVLGISCERCHGPGSEHVEYHRQHPKETAGRRIANPRDMTHRQRLDLCAQCHARLGTALTNVPFSYRPGARLADVYETRPPPPPGSPEDGSPHASDQFDRLAKSRCFASGRMDCVTCHDPHVVQHGSAQFSRHCLSCHKDAAVCPEVRRAGKPARAACVDCHMPRKNLVESQKAASQMLPRMRDHYIAKRPAELAQRRRELGLAAP